jgi:hypothetical protein
MLEKDFGLPKIHRLRIIHLYEANLNLLMGIYFARNLVRHIENNSGFNIGCYGNRPGLSAHEPVLVEELQSSIGYLSRTNQVVIDNDAQVCYDRIPPNLANLTSRSNGMDDTPCLVHGATLDNMSYSLMTALGLSEEKYTNTDESKVYGTGQGSTYPPLRGVRSYPSSSTPTENAPTGPPINLPMERIGFSFTCSVSSMIRKTMLMT